MRTGKLSVKREQNSRPVVSTSSESATIAGVSAKCGQRTLT